MGKDFIIIDKEFGVKKWFRWTYGIFLGVMLNFILDVTFSLLYATYNLIQPIENYLWAIVLSYLVFELLFLVNARLNKDYQWEHKPIQRFSLQFISNTTIAIGIVEVSRLVYIISFHDDYYISLMDEKIIMTFTSIVVLIFTVLESGLFLMGKWRYSLAELERFKKENVEIRFESLRSQLNPHFLFNSLNTLSSLIYENQDKASLFIRELSDVYRYILENRDKELIALEKELDFSNSYIHLLQLRFGENLCIENKVTDHIADFQIAPLTLQLLIENAVKHNIISKKQPLQIRISIEDDLMVVQNSLQPKPKPEYTSETGLNNIKSRYEFLTGRQVEILKNDTDFVVKIPLL